MKRRLLNLSLFVGSCVVALVLTELLARAFFDVPLLDQGKTVAHPRRVYTLRPGYNSTHRFQGAGTEQEIAFAYSSQGLRNSEIGPKQPGEWRILMLGDSFTEGLTLPNDETIPAALQQILDPRGTGTPFGSSLSPAPFQRRSAICYSAPNRLFLSGTTMSTSRRS